MMAWTPSIGAIEPSDNESEKSGSASPSGGGGSHSPLVANPARSASIPAEHEVTINFVIIQVVNFDKSFNLQFMIDLLMIVTHLFIGC